MSTPLGRADTTGKPQAEDDLPIFLQPEQDAAHIAPSLATKGMNEGWNGQSLQAGVSVNALLPSSPSSLGTRQPLSAQDDAPALQWLNHSPGTLSTAFSSPPPPAPTALLHEAFQWDEEEGQAARADNKQTTHILFEAGTMAGMGRAAGSVGHAPYSAHAPRAVRNEQEQAASLPQPHDVHAVASLAAEADLCLLGETGQLWCLRRQRVLGKGSYGCATLYRRLEPDAGEEAATHATPPPPPSAAPLPHASPFSTEKLPAFVTNTTKRRKGTDYNDNNNDVGEAKVTDGYVVVKSIDEQTMSDRVKELAGLEMELRTLRRCAGHPHMVQFVDYCHRSAAPAGTATSTKTATRTNALTSPASPSYRSMNNMGSSSSSALAQADEAKRVRYILMEYCGGGDLAGYMEAFQQQQRQAAAAPVSTNNGKSMSSSSSNVNAGTPGLRVVRQDSVPESFVASVLIQLFVGLHFLHAELHVLHRDIKSQNIFLLADRATVRIGDFGIAAELPSLSTTLREAYGTPFYMAPELCKEEAYGLPVDVWAAGVVLYELMCGTKPFKAATTQALLRRVTSARGMYGTAVCLTDEGGGVQRREKEKGRSGGAGERRSAGSPRHRGHKPTSLAHDRSGSNSSSSSNDEGVDEDGEDEGQPGWRRALAARYSPALRALVQSFFTINPIARPTVRQVLRNAYVRQNLRHVPPDALRSPYYAQIFGEELIHGIVGTPAAGQPGSCPPARTSEGKAAATPVVASTAVQPAKPQESSDEARWNELYADDDFESDSDA